jgi:hypothetical protein
MKKQTNHEKVNVYFSDIFHVEPDISLSPPKVSKSYMFELKFARLADIHNPPSK